MRGGPSTGLPTLIGQADVMQAKWGSHGDYEAIAYAPSTPQEMFDLTIKAFNMADVYRQPVFVLGDEAVGHLTERVIIPEASAIPYMPRKKPPFAPGQGKIYEAVDDDLVPPMPFVGEGYRIQITGEPHVHLELSVSSDLGDHNHAGCLATAMHVINAIPAVVAAEPGVKTMLDLPVYSALVPPAG